VVGSLAVPHRNSSAAKPPATLALDTNTDTDAINISDVIAPTTTRYVTECSDDDNNDTNKEAHVITLGAPPFTIALLSNVYPSVSMVRVLPSMDISVEADYSVIPKFAIPSSS
jgi:hypothetical protein